MADEKQSADTYPLLSSMVRLRGMEMEAVWRHPALVRLFETSVRTIQDWEANPEKEFSPRDLPGGRGHLCEDLEEFLRKSAGRRPTRRKPTTSEERDWSPLRPTTKSKKGRKGKAHRQDVDEPPQSDTSV